ncbi:MAG: NAD+ synthase [Alphaproteobacteria bacterium]
MSFPSFCFALAQINPTVGDIAGNCERILKFYHKAKDEGVDMVITPESSVTGYSPEDLVFMQPFRQAAMEAVHKLAAATKNGPALIVGSPWDEDGDERAYNAAILMDEGRIRHIQYKTVLPNHGVFDERRIYKPGAGSVATWRGIKLGILICEDVWSPEAPQAMKDQGAELLIAINASPYRAGKRERRCEVIRQTVMCHGLPFIYLNIVGGQDDIVFDGGSFILSGKAEELAFMPEFKQSLMLFSGSPQLSAKLPQEETIWEAMKLGLADYVRKNGFSTVVLGLSGGIDSALTAAVAVDALGPQNVKGVLLPSPHSSDHSISDAELSAKLLGIETFTIPIETGMQALEAMLDPVMKPGWMDQLHVGGNLQSRLRGMSLMALSNQHGWMLLSTGNKSEVAVGYTTLYGDACGSYNVLKDLYKTQVYEMANWRNAQGPAIPQGSIEKPPSAELAPGQLDADQLPSYDVLDEILYHHIEMRMGAEEIIARGYDEATVRKVLKLVLASEYKRRQSCPGVKLSTMMFGKDRRFPMTNKF